MTNTVTLIYGERDAVLVDTFLSVQHSERRQEEEMWQRFDEQRKGMWSR